MKSEPSKQHPSRRTFLKTASSVTAASALSGVALPHVFAAVNNTIQVAVVGCGGRGTGAAVQALSVKSVPTRLVAMADVFAHKLDLSHSEIGKLHPDNRELFDVPEERKFLGFDAYRKAMDCLRPGDIVILATPPAFRWVHFGYAIKKGLNVFMEKPVTVDGPTSKRMLGLADQADQKGLKVGVGLMVRHCRGRQELYRRIRDGEIGEIIALRAYRMHHPVGSAFSEKKPDDRTELMYQIERFHSFLWASGGLFSDFYIHQIDECCWMKNAWPVKAQALGGRHYRGDSVDQNFDTYSAEYTFDDGTKLFLDGRTMIGCYNNMSSTAHASKGSAIISFSGHTPGKVRTFKGQLQRDEDLVWAHPQPETNPYQNEWDDLVDAILKNTPYNEVRRGVQASLVTSMGRMAAHTGQEITFEQMVNSNHEFAPGLDRLTTEDSPAPVRADKDGKYPVPQPGLVKDVEYRV